MTRDQACALFSALPPERQIAVIARVGWELTIEGRGTYVAGTDDVARPQRLRAVNETLHRLLSQIRNIAEGRSERFPDDIIVSIMWETAAKHVQEALEVT